MVRGMDPDGEADTCGTGICDTEGGVAPKSDVGIDSQAKIHGRGLGEIPLDRGEDPSYLDRSIHTEGNRQRRPFLLHMFGG